MKLYYSFTQLFLFVISILCQTKYKVSSADAISAISSQIAENSYLHKGFQFAYSIANSFIDSIEIKFPPEIFPPNETTIPIDLLSERVSNYFKSYDFNKVRIFQT